MGGRSAVSSKRVSAYVSTVVKRVCPSLFTINSLFFTLSGMAYFQSNFRNTGIFYGEKYISLIQRCIGWLGGFSLQVCIAVIHTRSKIIFIKLWSFISLKNFGSNIRQKIGNVNRVNIKFCESFYF